MCTTIRIVLAMVREAFLSRAALHLENLALRQQLAALDRKGARPSLRMADRLFWVVLSRLWSGWREILVIVKPETVIGWHRKGFRRFWTRKSRRGKPGRPPVSSEFRGLIRRMSRENPLWGAPRIHGELRMLGFEVSEAAVSKLSLPFISSAVETLEFCIPTGYLFRHAQDHQHAHLRLPRNRPWPRSALHRNPCPATAGSCPETEKAPAIASEGG